MSFKKNTLDRIQESDCYNKEAFRLYRDSTSSFANLAAQSAQLSSSDSVLFNMDDGHPKGNLKARQGVSSGSGSRSVRSSSGRGMSMSATGGGNRSPMGSGISTTGPGTGTGLATAEPGLMFERLAADKLRVERE